MSYRVFYRAWDTATNTAKTGDAGQHTCNVEVNGTLVTGLTELEVANGTYAIELSDVQCPEGARFVVVGSSGTADVAIFGEAGTRPATNLATAANVTAAQSSIEAACATATGFATPANVTAAQVSIEAACGTATGFATPANVTTAQSSIEAACATATGFSTHTAAAVWTNTARELSTTGERAIADRILDGSDPGDYLDQDSFGYRLGNIAREVWDALRADRSNVPGSFGEGANGSYSSIAATYADTHELQQNQSQWATATGFATAADVTTAQASIEVLLQDCLTESAYTMSLPAFFDQLLIETGTGKVTTANPATGGTGSLHTPADVVNAIIASSIGTDLTATLADTNELQLNQGQWATATGFATPADLGPLLTSINFTAALPANFGTLAIDASGYVTATNSGSGGDAPTAIENATAVRAELTTELARIDTAVSAAPATALAVYDGPTRAEATADKAEILTTGNTSWVTGSGGTGTGSATVENQEAILAKLAGETTLLSSPVSNTGDLVGPYVIGDDYKGSRAFVWSIDEPDTYTGTETAHFGMRNERKGSYLVEGAVTDNGDGTWNLTFEVPKEDTAGFAEGTYEWSVELRDSDGNEITRVRHDGHAGRACWVEKQT